MARRGLSSRSRFVLAAAIATLPLLVLVSYAAVDRYDADRTRAKTRATTRADLYATLLAQTGGAAVPSGATLTRLLTLVPLTSGTAIDLFDGSGSLVVTAGTAGDDPPADDPRLAAALARRTGTFEVRGPDGVERVWGFAPVEGSPLTVGYGLTGSDVYGASRTALRRDLALAIAAALAAIAAAFALAGRATAPIRRLAAQFAAGGKRAESDIGALEHGIQRLGAEIEDSHVELARRAERLEQLNRELHERERAAAQLAAIVESSGDAIIGKSLDGTILTWNAGAERLYGYSADEIVGQSVSLLAPPERRDEIRAILDQIGGGGRVERLEAERVTKDGRRLNVSLTVSPVHGSDGELSGASTIARDISERVAAEREVRQLNEELEDRVVRRTAQLESANRELEAFSYSVSHDLRAPLRAIDGFSRLVIEDHAAGLDAEGLRYLGLVSKNTQDMGRLIDGLLAFSRLGQRQLDKRRIDVEALTREVVDSLSIVHDGRASSISIGDLPAADADPTLLRQVFANLLENAIKFTREAEQPRIEVDSYDDGGPPVYVVRDNGVGFDMRYADKLFTVFQRLHRVESYEGTGIGLALVARIVDRHGGRIWAEGKPDEGATFYFTLDEGEPEP